MSSNYFYHLPTVTINTFIESISNSLTGFSLLVRHKMLGIFMIFFQIKLPFSMSKIDPDSQDVISCYVCGLKQISPQSLIIIDFIF